MDLPFLTIAIALIIFICIILGFTRGIKRSFYSLLANLISAICAFGLTRVVILIMSKRALAPIGEKVLNNKVFQGIINPSGLDYTNKFVGTLVLAICLFYILYVLLVFISQPIKRAIFSKTTKVTYSKYNVLLEKKWYIKILAVIISVISGLLTVITISFSIISFSDAANVAYEKTNTSKNYMISIIEKDYSTPILKKAFTKPLFNALTKMHDANVKTVTTNEIEAALKVYYSIENIREEKDLYDNLTILNESISSSEIVPEVAAKIIVNEANKYEVKQPKKNEKGMDARLARLENELLLVMKSSNKDNIKSNTLTATTIGKELVLKDAYKISSYKEVVSLLKDEDFTENIMLELFENSNTQEIMSNLIDLCVGSVFDELKIDVKGTYIFSLDYSKLTSRDIKNEANAISSFAKHSESIAKLSKNETIDKEELEELKKDLDIVKDSKIVTDIVYTSINGFIKNMELVVSPTEENSNSNEVSE